LFYTQEPTTLFLLFDEMVGTSAAEAQIDVLLGDVNSNCTMKLTAEWMNPFTFTFTAPGILT
jgi:hypothetical protein